jgi:uncharacterized membrane protein
MYRQPYINLYKMRRILAPSKAVYLALCLLLASGTLLFAFPSKTLAETATPDKLEITAKSAKVSTTVGGLSTIAGGTCVFYVDFIYSGSTDRTFDVSLNFPKGWDVFMTQPGVFNPASLLSGDNPTPLPDVGILQLDVSPGDFVPVDIVATPPKLPLPSVGDYTIKINAVSGTLSSNYDLTATISATYGMQFVPVNSTLNLKAVPGAQNYFTLKLDNTGDSKIDAIKFYSDKAEGWKVGVYPGELESITGHNSQILTLVIIPSENTIIGDYSIAFYAYGTQMGAVTDIRVTVDPPVVWAWIGIIGVVVLLAALIFVYTRFRRR